MLKFLVWPLVLLYGSGSFKAWLSPAPALSSSVPLSSNHVWLFTARLLLHVALITSGSLRFRLFPARLLSAQLFSTPAHTAWYYIIYLSIYTEPGKAYSDTSKVLYKEKDIQFIEEKTPNQCLIRRPCRLTENSLAYNKILSGNTVVSSISNRGVAISELPQYIHGSVFSHLSDLFQGLKSVRYFRYIGH
jgi:hypothetical protein